MKEKPNYEILLTKRQLLTNYAHVTDFHAPGKNQTVYINRVGCFETIQKTEFKSGEGKTLYRVCGYYSQMYLDSLKPLGED